MVRLARLASLQWRHNECDGSQITSLMIVYSIVCSGADQRKHQNSTSLAFLRGIHRWPVNSPHKGSLTRKMFPLWRHHLEWAASLSAETDNSWVPDENICWASTVVVNLGPDRSNHIKHLRKFWNLTAIYQNEACPFPIGLFFSVSCITFKLCS